MDAVTAPVDDLLDALADARRRRLLVALLESGPEDDSPLTVEDVAAAGDDVAMVHVHLPKLADYGFVEWDSVSGEIRRGPKFDEVAPLLARIDERADELPPDWL